MPIIHRKEAPRDEVSGNARATLASKEQGARSLSVAEVTVPPGGKIPLHTHPGHEECMVILEGTLNARVGDATHPVSAGDAVIAPSDAVHGMTNTSGRPARLLAIFPTTDVKRQVVEG